MNVLMSLITYFRKNHDRLDFEIEIKISFKFECLYGMISVYFH
jgi:hypothetical protein